MASREVSAKASRAAGFYTGNGGRSFISTGLKKVGTFRAAPRGVDLDGSTGGITIIGSTVLVDAGEGSGSPNDAGVVYDWTAEE